MNFGTHGGSCGHSCCLRIQDLEIKIGNQSILSNVNLHVHCGDAFRTALFGVRDALVQAVEESGGEILFRNNHSHDMPHFLLSDQGWRL